MKLQYKGIKPTKAHKDDIGLDLHPVTVTIVFRNEQRVTIDCGENVATSDLIDQLEQYIAENKRITFWNQADRGIAKLVFDSGTCIAPPAGVWMMLCPNSRVCKTESLIMQNSVGIIDPGYRGSVKATYIATEREVCINDILMLCRTCGQLLPFNVIPLTPELSDDLGSTERGTKGFGSSDN